MKISEAVQSQPVAVIRRFTVGFDLEDAPDFPGGTFRSREVFQPTSAHVLVNVDPSGQVGSLLVELNNVPEQKQIVVDSRDKYLWSDPDVADLRWEAENYVRSII